MTDHSDRRIPAAAQQPDGLFSPDVIAELSDALNDYLATGGAGQHVKLEAAMRHLCTEAHKRDLRPEQMIVQVKAVWLRIPLLVSMHEARAGAAWDRVVSTCLQAYYANESSKQGPP